MPQAETSPGQIKALATTLTTMGVFQPPSNPSPEAPALLPSTIPSSSSETPITKPQKIHQFFTELLPSPVIDKFARITAAASIAAIYWLSQPNLIAHAQSEDLCDNNPQVTCTIKKGQLIVDLEPGVTIDVGNLFLILDEIPGCLAVDDASPFPLEKLDNSLTSKPDESFEIQIEDDQLIFPSTCGGQKPVHIPLDDFIPAIENSVKTSTTTTQPTSTPIPETESSTQPPSVTPEEPQSDSPESNSNPATFIENLSISQKCCYPPAAIVTLLITLKFLSSGEKNKRKEARSIRRTEKEFRQESKVFNRWDREAEIQSLGRLKYLFQIFFPPKEEK